MTYCVGLLTEDGVVLMADTRTNAGFDNIATFSKLKTVEGQGRAIGLMSSGNLALTQAATAHLEYGLPREDGARRTLATAASMFEAASLVGAALRMVHREHAEALAAQNIAFEASFLLGGQIDDEPPRLYQIYSAGNFIAAEPDTPFLQIGEHKYGKPILDRAAQWRTPLPSAVKLLLLSMDATLRSNLSVGLPIDVAVIRSGSHRIEPRLRIEENDPYFTALREGWSEAIGSAYRALPDPPWTIDACATPARGE